MAVMLVDSCDHVDTAAMKVKWPANLTNNITVVSSAGRYGGNAYRNNLIGSNTVSYLALNFTAINSATMGWAMKIAGLNIFGGGGNYRQIAFCRISGNKQMSMSIQADGTLALRDNFDSLIALSSRALNYSAWNYIEWKLTPANSPGSNSNIIKVNGEEFLNTTADTQGQSTAGLDSIGIGNMNIVADLDAYYDDIYLLNNDTGSPTGFLGDQGIYYLRPDGAGNSTSWSPSSGNNWEAVDDLVPDFNTSYVTSNTVNAIDLYTMTNLPSSMRSITGVQSVLYSIKASSGTANIAPMFRVNGTNYQGTTVDSSATAIEYNYNFEQFVNNPDTASAWTDTAVNGLEFGEKFISE